MFQPVETLVFRPIANSAKRWKPRLKQSWEALGYELAKLYRPRLRQVCFIGTTGSCGKTTSNELIGAVLSSRYRGRTSHQLYNGPNHIAKTLLTVAPWHQFCAHEVGCPAPGVMAKSLRIFKPHVGIVTHISKDHHTSFRTLEATAAEKGKLIEALPGDGAAILNADDPRVLAMRELTRARVFTYGLSEAAMVRAEEVSSVWPERLSLTVVYGSARVRVRTRLVGEHWIHAILAALATGIARGISLTDGARAVERVEPVEGRMNPVIFPDGVIFIQDDWKAPLWTIPASLHFIRTARATRKIVIIGTISDYSGQASRTYRAVARQALGAAEKVIFVGPLAHCAVKARSGEDDDRLLAFETLHELNAFLGHYLELGDLVLLKGSRHTDHLERLVLARSSAFACWRTRCDKGIHCQRCSLRLRPFIPATSS
jgi:UDP-N-acetylmuramoyl-tripeptide--D-alanyl-D-alanine ligase